MHRLRTVLMIGVVAVGFGVLGLANPGCAYACSCIQPQPIAEYAALPDTVILTGTVTAADANQQGLFRVERWYKGTSAAIDVPIRGGNGADCGIPLTVGMHMILVATVANGILQPSICSPWGDLSTPEGRQLQDEALLALGEGTLPGGSGEPGGSPPETPTIPWIVVIGAGVAVLLVVVVAGASFVSGRRGG